MSTCPSLPMGAKAVNTVGDRIPQLPLLELEAATIAVSELPADQYGGCWQNLLRALRGTKLSGWPFTKFRRSGQRILEKPPDAFSVGQNANPHLRGGFADIMGALWRERGQKGQSFRPRMSQLPRKGKIGCTGRKMEYRRTCCPPFTKMGL